MRWQAFVDGTAAPNPGPLGIGVVVVAADGTRHDISRALDERGDNNDAEFAAVVAALDVVAAVDTGADVVVHSDSDVVVRLLNGTKTTTQPRLLQWLARANDARAQLGVVEVVLVTRLRNGEADALARAALGLVARVPRHLRPKKKRR